MSGVGYFWSPRVPRRAVALSVGALIVPVSANLFFSDVGREYEFLLWLLALVPAFLLAYYKGWRGAAGAIALGMAMLAVTQALAAAAGRVGVAQPVHVVLLIGFLTVALGVGWLSEMLHRQRLLAEKNALELITLLNAQGRIVYESPAIERMLGYKPEELLGKHVTEFVHPEDTAQAVAFLKREGEASPEETAQAEFRFRHKDGSWRVLQSEGMNLLDDPRVGGVLVSSRDLTERKWLEEQLRQAHKMEAIGRLAAGVAHDFRNLLTAILGNAMLLQETLAEDDKRRGEVEEIIRTAEQGTDLTRQLLTFSRKQPIQTTRVDLNAIIVDLEKMLRRLIGSRITLTAALDAELAQVLVDPSQMQQVILNLVVNARDAMPSGGPLVITTRNTLVGEGQKDEDLPCPAGLVPGAYVVLAVTDAGTGMDEQTALRIFEPFFTTKPATVGTGLGLSTVYGIVQQAGGRILVQSQPGKGSTFSVFLPSAERVEPVPA